VPGRIEDYALIGDTQTAALVSRDGSMDWLCFPRFDSGACFAGLLGTPDHGRWLVAPSVPVRRVTRRYRGPSLVLETRFETDEGDVTVIDWMPPRTAEPDVIRMVVGERGTVPMHTELVIRFDYGSIVPWVRRTRDGITAVGGPDAVNVFTTVGLRGRDFRTVGEFSVGEGDREWFVLAWHPSHEDAPECPDVEASLESTESWWRRWSEAYRYGGEWKDAVLRSLILLKAMTYGPTGGVVAAPTTSLPEQIGGVRNWDYRICWIRDATLTLQALLSAGFHSEARAWRDWLIRAVAGHPQEMQIMYGPAGERRLTELELPWLPGYEGSAPVRVGNAAFEQLQLDVYGEVTDSMYRATAEGIEDDDSAGRIQRALLEHLEGVWDEPDYGIWEVRGRPRHFTHSKVMAWVALDRGVRAAQRLGSSEVVDRWRALRDQVHEEVCRRAYDDELGAFVQYVGSKRLDASLLRIPLVGFLPATDERVRGTIDGVITHLGNDGFVYRYETDELVDGLPPGEGAFLPCSFWLVECLTLLGRRREARALFERLLDLRNDVGLLAEEYDPSAGRMLGNFPQAFTHVGLVNAAARLSTSD
jgi:GH15 family glucan-1,4-alpha-glucosidase